MTFSILAIDQKTGALGAAAATGSLCVGGWVIRGALGAGLVASQGTAPSTLWRDDALGLLRSGHPAETAVKTVVSNDNGRAHRQLIALDRDGKGAGFTGEASIAWAGHRTPHGLAVAGNMIEGQSVIDALETAFAATDGELEERLFTALTAAEAAGGDSRGLQSAALLVLHPDRPPLDLRIDHAADPLTALGELMRLSQTRPYADWLNEVPVASDPTRAPEAAMPQPSVKD